MSSRATKHATPEAIYPFEARAIKPLPGDDTPTRGFMAVSLREPLDACITGVAGNVLSLLTGAASGDGFAGFASCFLRRDRRQRVLLTSNRYSAGACCLEKGGKS